MRLTTARDEFLAYRRTGSPGRRALSPTSLKRYYSTLTTFSDWVKVAHAKAQQGKDSVLLFTADLCRAYILCRSGNNDLAPNTLALDCAVLREFARWGTKRRYWSPEAVEDMPAVQKPMGLPRPMAPEERDAVFSLQLSTQDSALRALLYYSGCRESEIVSLRLHDLRPPQPLPDGTVAMGLMRIWGKGRRERAVDLHPALWAALVPHLSERRGSASDALLFATRDGRPHDPRWIISRVHAWARRCQPPISGLTPHRFRHTFATDALEHSHGEDDLRALQQLLGHKKLETTQIYTRVVNRRRAAVVAALPTFPFTPPGSFRPPQTAAGGQDDHADS